MLRDGVLAVVIGDGYAGCGCWTRGGRAPPARARCARARAEREKPEKRGFSTEYKYNVRHFLGVGTSEMSGSAVGFHFLPTNK